MTSAEEIAARLDRLEAEVTAGADAHDLASGGDERGDGHHHPAEAATDAETRERDLRAQIRVQERLERIRAARERLAAGRYGLCVGCGGPIPERRLEAVPDALRCVPCQSRADRRG